MRWLAHRINITNGTGPAIEGMYQKVHKYWLPTINRDHWQQHRLDHPSSCDYTLSRWGGGVLKDMYIIGIKGHRAVLSSILNHNYWMNKTDNRYR